MLRKVIKVRGLGRIRALDWGNSPEIQKLALVFADNGTGKTTLAAALRAARDGSRIPIHERRTLGLGETVLVQLLTTGGTVAYDGSQWNQKLEKLDIFDRFFVETNVFIGSNIGPDQRHNLYRLALGASEVKAARALEEQNVGLKKLTARRKEIEDRLTAQCNGIGIALKTLISLSPNPASVNIAETALAEARLTALSAEKDLRTLSQISRLPELLPLDAQKLRALLEESAEVLSEEVAARVRSHIKKHLDDQGESWLLQGVKYAASGDTCPFCTQSLSASDIATYLPKFFDDAYQSLLSKIDKGLERVESWRAWGAKIVASQAANHKALVEWRPLIRLPEPPDLGTAVALINDLVANLSSVLCAKRASPLSKFGTDPRVEEIDKAHVSLIEGLTSYRNWSDAASNACKSLLVERETECAKLESQIRNARALQLRSQPSVQQDLEALKRLDFEIRQKSEQKQRAQEDLEQMEQSRTSSFLTAINKVLSDFGAGFTLKDLESKLTNTRVNSDFEIALLEGGQIRASSKRDGEPRVGTVLSEGDRTTLALAIFIATTLGSGDVGNRIVVLDDPLTSLDRNRRTWTCNYIVRLLKACDQVIVLSHDEFFLRDIRGLAKQQLGTDPTQLRLCHRNGRCILEKWDTVEECMSKYFRDLARLEHFGNGGSSQSITSADDAQRLIRSILEEYLRFRFPRAWGAKEWLGDFLAKAAQGDVNVPLATDHVERLRVWCGFSSPSHHGDPVDPPVSPAETEVRAIAKQVLAFVQA